MVNDPIRLVRNLTPLIVLLFSFSSALGQSSEFDDPAVGEDKAYFINGDSITFSGNPLETQVLLLGKWSTLQGIGQSLDLNFTDNHTVIAGYEDGARQSKGTWSLNGSQITCSFNNDDPKLPRFLSATVKPAGIEVEGYGLLSKND